VVSYVSSRWVKPALLAVVVGAILTVALSGHVGWFGLGATPPGPFGATLVAEGAAGTERWAVVAIRTADGEGLHLRHRGVEVTQAVLGVENVLDRRTRSFRPGGYEVAVVGLPGTDRSVLFGLLPAGAVRAETAQGGVEVRQSTLGPYVIAPAPAGDDAAIDVQVYDSRSQELRP
jgi:hypothetical protein